MSELPIWSDIIVTTHAKFKYQTMSKYQILAPAAGHLLSHFHQPQMANTSSPRKMYSILEVAASSVNMSAITRNNRSLLLGMVIGLILEPRLASLQIAILRTP